MKRSFLGLTAILLSVAPAAAQDTPLVSELETLIPGETGSVVLAYDVTADGRAMNCKVERSSGFPRLDAASCEMMIRYGRFPSGAPARVSRTINWVTPTARAVAARPAPVAERPRMSAGTAAEWASLNPDWTSGRED